MDLHEAFSRIDELYSLYMNSKDLYKNAIKAKLIKLICEIIKSDYKIKKIFENGDSDYLPVLEAINDSLQYFNNTSENSHFSSYVLCSVKKRIIKDVSTSNTSPLSNNALKLRKKIIKILELYANDKERVAKVLDIPISKINELLTIGETLSLDNKDKNEEYSLLNIQAVRNPLIEENLQINKNLQLELSKIEEAWKQLKEMHRPIVSDWLTAEILHELISAKFEKDLTFLSVYSFINKSIVKNYYSDINYELLRSYDSIAKTHGITKSAVCKKIDLFTEELKKQNN